VTYDIDVSNFLYILFLVSSLRIPCLAAEAILLAFQNYILMLGTSVMIPSWIVHAMGGSDVC